MKTVQKREKKKKNPLDPLRCVAVRKGRSTHTHAVSKSYFSKEEKRLDIFILLLIHTRVYFPLCTYYTLALSSRDNLLGAQTIRMKIGKKKEREKKKKRPRFEIFVRKIYLLYLLIHRCPSCATFCPVSNENSKIVVHERIVRKRILETRIEGGGGVSQKRKFKWNYLQEL